MAQNLETIHAVPILSTVPEHGVEVRENGRSSHSSIATTLTEEANLEPARELTSGLNREDKVAGPTHEAMLVLAEETLAIPMKDSVDSLVRPLVESVALVESKEPALEAAAAKTANGAVITEEVLPETALEAAALNPIVSEVIGKAAPSTEEGAPAAESIEAAANEDSLRSPVQAEAGTAETAQIEVLASQIESSPTPVESEPADEPPGIAVAALTLEPVSTSDSIQASAIEPSLCEVPPAPLATASAEPVSTADPVQPADERPQHGALPASLEAQTAGEPVPAAETIPNTAIEPLQCEAQAAPQVTQTVHNETVSESEPVSTADPVQAAGQRPQHGALPASLEAQTAGEPVPAAETIPNTATEPLQCEAQAAPLVAHTVHNETVSESAEPVSTADPVHAASEPRQREGQPTQVESEPVSTDDSIQTSAIEPRQCEAQSALLRTEPIETEPAYEARESTATAFPIQAASEPSQRESQSTQLESESVSTDDAIQTSAIEPLRCEPHTASRVTEPVETEPAHEARESTSGADPIRAASEPSQRDAQPAPLQAEAAPQPVLTVETISNTASEPPQCQPQPAPFATEPVHTEPVYETPGLRSEADLVQAAAIEPQESEAPAAAHVAEPTHAERVEEAVKPASTIHSQLNDGFALEPPVSDPTTPDLPDEATQVLAVPVSEAQLAIDWDRPVEALAPSVDTPALDTEAICAALASDAEELVEAIARKLDIEYAAVRAVAASFERRPTLSLLCAPTEILTAPAPPIFETIGMRGRHTLPMAPPPANLTSLTSPPQPPTLAGPCLPPELRNPTESRVSKDPRKSRSMPGWVISFIAAMLLLLIGVTAYQYFNSQGGGTASTSTQSASVSGGAQADAVAKSLEISGLRLTKSWSGKQQVRFLIINHSAQDLSGVTAQVTVKSDGSPVLLIQAPIRSLASNQSKEIRTDLDSDVPASVLADWQALRTEIRVTGQQ